MAYPVSVNRNDYHSNPKKSSVFTPLWLCKKLTDIITSAYNPKKILDPCAGGGNLTKFFREGGASVVEYEITRGSDFLASQEKHEVDLVIMNPPFNESHGKRSKLLSNEVWLRKILASVGVGTPIVMLTPFGFRLNQRHTSSRIQWMAKECPAITTIMSLTIDAFDDVLFHSEIVCYNTEKLKPHYFIYRE